MTGSTVSLVVTAAGVQATWTNNVNGNWTGGTNWSSNPNVPHSAGDTATLGGSSALRTITLDASESVGALAITNANSFVLANAGHALTLNNNGLGALLVVSAGAANSIQSAVALADNAQITVGGGASLAISGSISNSSGMTRTLTVNGAGTTILSGANSYGPSAGSPGTILSGGGILQLGNAGALGAGDVNVAGGSTLQAGAGTRFG